MKSGLLELGTEWTGTVVERGTAEWAAQDSRVGQSPTGCIDQDPREEQNLATAEWAAQDSRVGESPTGCVDQDPREEQSLAVGDWDWTSERAWTS